jgi:hypothetical protein
MNHSSDPGLTVVLVTAKHSATLKRTIRYLSSQTVVDRIELILVGPDEYSLHGFEPSDLGKFHSYRTLIVGKVTEVERAFASGIVAGSAPVVALLENHVYPEPEWGSAIVRAHDGPWAVVGGVVYNANPHTATSWVEHLLSYGFHDETAPTGEVKRVSRNNSTFKRNVLEVFGDRLPDILARDGGLIDELQRRSLRSYREPAARLAHLNLSRVGPMLHLRLLSARAAAATRARAECWPLRRRLIYVAASPLFPLFRMRALWSRLRTGAARSLLPQIGPLLALALVLDAVGQAWGFAFGAGSSAERAGRYDLDREPYLCAADRARYIE